MRIEENLLKERFILYSGILAAVFTVTGLLAALGAVLPFFSYFEDPKKVELAILWFGLAVTPPLLGILLNFFDSYLEKNPRASSRESLLRWVSCVGLIGFFLTVNTRSSGFLFRHPLLSSVALVPSILATVWMFLPRRQAHLKQEQRICAFLSILLIVAIFFCALKACLIFNYPQGKRFVTHNAMHINAVLHPMVQVVLGKTLLSNLYSQYGLYPHFLLPYFQWFGFSLLKFSSLMYFLSCISCLFLFLLVRSFSGGQFFGLLALAVILGFNGYSFANDYVYFASFPIRLLFPSLVFFLAYRYFQRGWRGTYWTIHLACACALLWNLETGLFLYLAWVGTLLLHAFIPKGPRILEKLRSAGFHLLTVFFFTGFTFLVFYVYGLTRGHPIAFGEIFRFQQRFYFGSFFIDRINTLHPWTLVILVYIVAAGVSIRGVFKNYAPVETAPPLFIAIFGAMFFSYYQFRGHDDVLVFASYPAVLLLTLLLRAVSSRTKFCALPEKLMTGIMIWGLLSCVCSRFPPIYDSVRSLRLAIQEAQEGVNKPEYNYIATAVKYSSEGKGKILILSDNSGILHWLSKSSSPLNTAGPSEMVSRKDIVEMEDFLRSNHSVPVLLDKAWIGCLELCQRVRPILAAHYHLVETSNDLALEVYMPVNQRTDLVSMRP